MSTTRIHFKWNQSLVAVLYCLQLLFCNFVSFFGSWPTITTMEQVSELKVKTQDGNGTAAKV